MARLLEKYKTEIVPKLAEQFGYRNRMAVPKLVKIVVNMGVGRATEEAKRLEDACSAIAQITGQQPLVTKAKQSVSGFKLRKGARIGCKVTLRGRRMYEFLDRLISVAMPRIRDFRGLPVEAFDGSGNYSLGIAEQLVFPEVDPDKYEYAGGLQVTLVVDAKSSEESQALLSQLGMPFKV
ncbi:MAG: 50S ribosomal protein L5 [Planctomycetes bacterium]|nr:50S ribosomal protein L5 [Planctomycetota bacterium]